MKLDPVDIWKDRFCNECNSPDDVKELHLGISGITLCGDCRKKLIDLLEEEKKNEQINDI